MRTFYAFRILSRYLVSESFVIFMGEEDGNMLIICACICIHMYINIHVYVYINMHIYVCICEHSTMQPTKHCLKEENGMGE
jgi:hypothetical protein